MLQSILLLFNAAFASGTLTYLLDNKRDVALLGHGINYVRNDEKKYNTPTSVTKNGDKVEVVKSVDEGGYFLKVTSRNSQVTELTEIYRKTPGKYSVKRIGLDSSERVTSITSCEGGRTALVNDLACTSVSRDFCQQIASTVGDAKSLAAEVAKCGALEGKLKRVMDIHQKQMKQGALANQFSTDVDSLRTSFREVTNLISVTDVFKTNGVFKPENAGAFTANKILSLCQTQALSEGTMWASSAKPSNSLKNRGNAHPTSGADGN